MQAVIKMPFIAGYVGLHVRSYSDVGCHKLCRPCTLVIGQSGSRTTLRAGVPQVKSCSHLPDELISRSYSPSPVLTTELFLTSGPPSTWQSTGFPPSLSKQLAGGQDGPGSRSPYRADRALYKMRAFHSYGSRMYYSYRHSSAHLVLAANEQQCHHRGRLWCLEQCI